MKTPPEGGVCRQPESGNLQHAFCFSKLTMVEPSLAGLQVWRCRGSNAANFSFLCLCRRR